ncbi:hypothetical protein GCM10020219_000400 [Nonomuraea dietziae]
MGLNVRQRIIDRLLQAPASTPFDPADLRGRMRWYGLYTQRKPGIDGGKTAILEPEELDDRYFMLRVRIDGGQLSLEQLRVLADISNLYGRGTADLTRPAEHPVPLDRDRGGARHLGAPRGRRHLSTTEACGDTPRA